MSSRFLCRWFPHKWVRVRYRGIMLAGIRGIVAHGQEQRCRRCGATQITGTIK